MNISFSANPSLTVDLALLGNQEGAISRVYGADNIGSAGVPVFGGHDVDGDGHTDFGLSFFQSSPLGRSNAGSLALVFGDGTLGGSYNTAGFSTNILKVAGRVAGDRLGSEAWVDDVTGDGVGDLLICRQAASYAGRTGCGAITIIKGGPELRAHAESLSWLDIDNIPTSITALTFHGTAASDRVGIWVRTGDVTGDGINDVVVGADQVDTQGSDAGAVFVFRGGAHLATNLLVDAASYSASPLGDHITHFLPPASSANFHLGATLSVGDMNGDGRAEIVAAATINRAGAGGSFSAGGVGNNSTPAGAARGRMFIAWGENFSTNHWTNGYSFVIDQAPEGYTSIRGSSTMLNSDGQSIANSSNNKFGEELLSGRDYDGDGTADLFVGDITGRSKNRNNSGTGWVFFDVHNSLLNADIIMNDTNTWPTNLQFTVIHGPRATAISSDTANHGDYNEDGIDDLLVGNPCDDPPGRLGAGTVHVIYGQTNAWPLEIDLAPGALPSTMRIVEILGVKASDILCYSTCDGDVDGDGIPDLMMNEMQGDNPFNGQNDVGNLLIIGGKQFSEATDLDLLTGYDENPLVTTNEHTWSVVVLNKGPAAATNVVCTMTWPVELAVSTNHWTINKGLLIQTNGLRWEINDLGVLQAATASLTIQIDTNTPISFTNTIRSAQFAIELTPVNNNVTNVGQLLDSDGDLNANLFDPDDDNDFMPDTYEISFGLNPTNATDATSDGDMDGATAYQEFVAGTIPTNGLSAFILDIEDSSLDANTIQWPSVTGRIYHIECSIDVENSNAWVNVFTNLVGTGLQMEQVHTNANPYSVYRLQVETAP